MIKDINYDLVKMLHAKFDSVWRLERFYINDANQAKCESESVLNKILEEDRQHIQKLIAEIKKRMDAGTFE